MSFVQGFMPFKSVFCSMCDLTMIVLFTSVECERVFSVAGQINSFLCSTMLDSKFENLTTLAV